MLGSFQSHKGKLIQGTPSACQMVTTTKGHMSTILAKSRVSFVNEEGRKPATPLVVHLEMVTLASYELS